VWSGCTPPPRAPCRVARRPTGALGLLHTSRLRRWPRALLTGTDRGVVTLGWRLLWVTEPARSAWAWPSLKTSPSPSEVRRPSHRAALCEGADLTRSLAFRRNQEGQGGGGTRAQELLLRALRPSSHGRLQGAVFLLRHDRTYHTAYDLCVVCCVSSDNGKERRHHRTTAARTSRHRHRRRQSDGGLHSLFGRH
jgi:hypothetical protein